MEKIKIGEVCEILNGFAFKSAEYVDSGIRIIRIANVQKGYIEDNSPVFYPSDSSGLEKYMLQEGDLLMSLTGNVGRVAIIEQAFLPAVLNQRVACLRMKNHIVSRKYLYYLLNSDCFEQQCIRSARGVAQKNMSTEWLREYEIPVYSTDMQNHITAAFDKLRSIIDHRRQQLAKLDELVRTRFLEMFGNPVTNEKSWETIPLDEACAGIGDGLHGTPEYEDNGAYPFINGNNLMDGKIVITSATKMVGETTYRKHYIEITDNAILISINGTLGKIALYHGEQVMLGKSACYCNLKPEINRIFVYGLMRSDPFAAFLEAHATKSTIKNVGLRAMREYPLIIPPSGLQQQFAAFAEQAEQSKAAVRKSLDAAQLLFDSLMQEYFG